MLALYLRAGDHKDGLFWISPSSIIRGIFGLAMVREASARCTPNMYIRSGSWKRTKNRVTKKIMPLNDYLFVLELLQLKIYLSRLHFISGFSLGIWKYFLDWIPRYMNLLSELLKKLLRDMPRDLQCDVLFRFVKRRTCMSTSDKTFYRNIFCSVEFWNTEILFWHKNSLWNWNTTR